VKVALSLSIIIPCLNEAENIHACLSSIPASPSIEIIVVDGGSSDETISIVKNFSSAIKIVHSDRGRAKQMNTGARYARGAVLLFLHADTIAPKDLLEKISSFDSQDKKLWGRFDVQLSNRSLVYRVIEAFINYRSDWTNVATGDQAIFVKRNAFEHVTGFPDIPLMEDIAFSKIMKKKSEAYCIKSRMLTSSRRWEENGVIKTIILMWWLRFSYFIGVSPQRLHKKYY